MLGCRLKYLLIMKKIILVIASLFIASCVSIAEAPKRLQLYGIEVNSELYDDDYARKKDGKYTYLPSKMSPNIYAWGALTSYGSEFRISVNNNSNKPINSNYFLDKFNLYTKDNKQYVLKADDFLNYPKGYINPDDSAVFYVDKPNGLKSEENISKIVVQLGYDTRIVLKPTSKWE